MDFGNILPLCSFMFLYVHDAQRFVQFCRGSALVARRSSVAMRPILHLRTEKRRIWAFFVCQHLAACTGDVKTRHKKNLAFLMGECMWVLWNVQYWLVVRYVLFSTKFGMIMYCTQTLFQLQFFCRVQAAWAELRRRMDLILSRREHLPLVLLNWTGSGLFLRELHRLASYKGADGVGLLLSFVTVCLHYLHILHSCTK